MNVEIRSGPEEGKVVTVGKEPVVIGREDDCDIMLDDPAVSRHHATITLKGGVLSVADNDSANGVSVNYSKIDGSAELVGGDLITIGPLALFVLYEEPAEHAFVTSKADTQSVQINLPREQFEEPTVEAQVAELAAKAEPGLSLFGKIVIAVIAVAGIVLIAWLILPTGK
jgi:pSer/pThr/pTyr-binding forkhead associated (FHA) protein